MRDDYAKPFSADSHTIEAPEIYRDNVSRKFRDKVPQLSHDALKGVVYLMEGLPPIPVGGVCMGDIPYEQRGQRKARPFSELPRAGYDAKARLAAQDLDGVLGEVIYPTVGMVLCQLRDPDLRYEMLWAYNRWLQGFMEENPQRLVTIGQLAVRSVDDAVAELTELKRMGFKGAMLPGDPLTAEDYDDAAYDALWRTSLDLGVPLSFHSLTSSRATGNNLQSSVAQRGASRLAPLVNIVRSNQDVIAMLIFGGVFDRFPALKLVCVEADASWAPHLMLKMDQYYNTFRPTVGAEAFDRTPSEMFKENIYMTFQYDWLAIELADYMNEKRLMWANDCPHSDGTWPNSQTYLRENLPAAAPAERLDLILRDNVKALYGLA